MYITISIVHVPTYIFAKPCWIVKNRTLKGVNPQLLFHTPPSISFTLYKVFTLITSYHFYECQCHANTDIDTNAPLTRRYTAHLYVSVWLILQSTLIINLQVTIKTRYHYKSVGNVMCAET